MHKDEMETVINISAMDDYAEVYWGIPYFVRKLRKCLEEGLCELMFDHEEDIKVKVPLKNLAIVIRKPRKLSEERVAVLREMMNTINRTKGEQNV